MLLLVRSLALGRVCGFRDLVTQHLIDKGDAFAILQGALGLLRGDTKGLGLQFYGCYGLCGRILLMASLQV